MACGTWASRPRKSGSRSPARGWWRRYTPRTASITCPIPRTPWSRTEGWTMADQADVRRIALALPETVEADDRFAFSVLNKGKEKGFAWVWMERVEPKKPRIPRPDVLAVRVANLGEKESLLASDQEKFFT